MTTLQGHLTRLFPPYGGGQGLAGPFGAAAQPTGTQKIMDISSVHESKRLLSLVQWQVNDENNWMNLFRSWNTALETAKHEGPKKKIPLICPDPVELVKFASQ